MPPKITTVELLDRKTDVLVDGFRVGTVLAGVSPREGVQFIASDSRLGPILNCMSLWQVVSQIADRTKGYWVRDSVIWMDRSHTGEGFVVQTPKGFMARGRGIHLNYEFAERYETPEVAQLHAQKVGGVVKRRAEFPI
jgi:hypothetical protein